jgi:hypothetical protein
MNPLTGVLSDAWAMYRRHLAHFIAISFAIYLVVAALSALLSWGLGTFGAFLGAVISLAGMFLLQAALVKAVHDVHGGRAGLDLRTTITTALPYVGAVAVAGILAAIGITIGLALIIVPGLILLTFWSLIVPEIVIGGAGPLQSFGRSWRTVRGHGWHVFGTYVLVFLILIVAQIVLSVILLALPYGWRSFISELIVGTLVAPFIATVVTLIYYRLTAAHGDQAAPGSYGPPSAAAQGSPPPGYGQQMDDSYDPISGEGQRPEGTGNGQGAAAPGQGAGMAGQGGAPTRYGTAGGYPPPPDGSVPPQPCSGFDTPTGMPGRPPGSGAGQQPGGGDPPTRRPGTGPGPQPGGDSAA